MNQELHSTQHNGTKEDSTTTNLTSISHLFQVVNAFDVPHLHYDAIRSQFIKY